MKEIRIMTYSAIVAFIIIISYSKPDKSGYIAGALIVFILMLESFYLMYKLIKS